MWHTEREAALGARWAPAIWNWPEIKAWTFFCVCSLCKNDVSDNKWMLQSKGTISRLCCLIRPAAAAAAAEAAAILYCYAAVKQESLIKQPTHLLPTTHTHWKHGMQACRLSGCSSCVSYKSQHSVVWKKLHNSDTTAVPGWSRQSHDFLVLCISSSPPTPSSLSPSRFYSQQITVWPSVDCGRSRHLRLRLLKSSIL